MKNLLSEIKKCAICTKHLPLGPNPVLTASKNSRIAIIGQAPGLAVHKSGIPWDDKSGERLRDWLGIDKESFYNSEKIALVPMGFCYPGKGKSGDLPPRIECAPEWHDKVFVRMKNLELIILIGSYAQNYYLKGNSHKTLTERVKNFEVYLPKYLVLPHPSGRNNIWLKKNEWFEKELIPEMNRLVQQVL